MATKPKIVKLTANSAKMLNAIKNNASANYKAYVPTAVYGDTENLKAIGTVFMQYPGLYNEFLENLYNRIGRVIITSKLYDNPLSFAKKGLMEFGQTVEELFVNPADVRDYPTDAEDANPFARVHPDVKAAYHVINYEKQYQQTIDASYYLRRAFTSWDGVDDLIAKITESIYTAANFDEFLITKYLLARKILSGEMYVEEVEAGNTQDALEDNASTMRAISNNLEFLGNKYNLAGVYTHTPRDNQYIFVNTEYSAYMDVKVLASAFNMDKAEFLGHRVLLNGFSDLDGTNTNARINKLMTNAQTGEYLAGYTPLTTAEVEALNAIPAFVVDIDFFQLYDQFQQFTEQYNPRRNYWNYFYTVSKIISASPFANSVAFVPGTPAVTSVTISPSTATIVAGQSVTFETTVVTSNFAPQTVTYALSGDGADKARISSDGVLVTESDATGTITVTATSTFDTTKYAEATVTIGV